MSLRSLGGLRALPSMQEALALIQLFTSNSFVVVYYERCKSSSLSALGVALGKEGGTWELPPTWTGCLLPCLLQVYSSSDNAVVFSQGIVGWGGNPVNDHTDKGDSLDFPSLSMFKIFILIFSG